MKNFIRWIRRIWFKVTNHVKNIELMDLHVLKDYPGEGTPKGKVPNLFLLKREDDCLLASQDKNGNFTLLTDDEFYEVGNVRAFQHSNGNILIASPDALWEYFNGQLHNLISQHYSVQRYDKSEDIWIAMSHNPNAALSFIRSGLNNGIWVYELKRNADGSFIATTDIHELSPQATDLVGKIIGFI